MTPGTDIAVLERGGMMKQLSGKSERCLVLGAAVLDGMRVREFKAILAHEYGHFHNEDTAGGGFALAVRRSLMSMALHLVRGRAASALNPAWWFVRGFHSVFLRVSQGASRLQEVLADRWAAHAYGAEAFSQGLKHVVERSVRFDAHVHATLNEVVPKKQPLPNMYAHVPTEPVDPKKIDESITKAMTRPASPYDSHPRPADRIEWVSKLSATPESERPEDTEDAWSLLEGREWIEKEMTAKVRANLAEQGVTLAA
jgi:Zn-dependent protease with chaperone function